MHKRIVQPIISPQTTTYVNNILAQGCHFPSAIAPPRQFSGKFAEHIFNWCNRRSVGRSINDSKNIVRRTVGNDICYVRCFVDGKVVPQDDTFVVYVVGSGVFFDVGEDVLHEVSENILVTVLGGDQTPSTGVFS